MILSQTVKNSLGLSVIIITKDEEFEIQACLESISGFVDEIIVVDSGSKDRTLEICKKYTQKIFHNDWKGYSDQKQFALGKTQGPWVLNIDADERVSPALQNEITESLQGEQKNLVNGFLIPFNHYFLGKKLRFGGVRGEKHVRLFKKEMATYGNEKIHEGIQVTSPLGQLKNAIDHFSYRNLEEYLKKCNLYTSLIAEKKFSQGKRFSMFHHLRLPYEFFIRYFIKLGFLDGEKGLTYALLSSYYGWLKYMKLRDWEGKK